MVIKLHHALIAFLVFILITSILRNSYSLYKNMPFFDQLTKEYNREKAENRKLKLEYAKSQDPHEVEKVLRDKLGYTKEGEKILIYTDATLTPTPE